MRTKGKARPNIELSPRSDGNQQDAKQVLHENQSTTSTFLSKKFCMNLHLLLLGITNKVRPFQFSPKYRLQDVQVQ